MNLITFDGQFQRLQGIAGTGTRDAFSGVNDEKCIMRRTLDKCLVEIKELVLLPFKTGTGMRTLVEISKELTVFMYDKNSLGSIIYYDLETFAARVFDISCFAEYVCHNVC